MNQRFIGLRFILVGGGFLQSLLPVQEAETIVRNFLSGTLKDDTVLGGINVNAPNHTVGSWAIRVRDISGLHTFEPEPAHQVARPLFPQGPAISGRMP